MTPILLAYMENRCCSCTMSSANIICFLGLISLWKREHLVLEWNLFFLLLTYKFSSTSLINLALISDENNHSWRFWICQCVKKLRHNENERVQGKHTEYFTVHQAASNQGKKYSCQSQLLRVTIQPTSNIKFHTCLITKTNQIVLFRLQSLKLSCASEKLFKLPTAVYTHTERQRYLYIHTAFKQAAKCSQSAASPHSISTQ